MNPEKTLLSKTGQHCVVCNNYNDECRIVEKITENILTSNTNGIYGPGRITWNETNLLVTHYCENCGLVYLPTKNNKLHEFEHDRFKMVKEKFPHIDHVSLQRSLENWEVIEINNSSVSFLKETGYFYQNDILWLYSEENVSTDVLGAEQIPMPYIVPFEESFKIQFWSKLSFEGKQNIPLPEGSILVLKVFHPQILKDFYIPSESLK